MASNTGLFLCGWCRAVADDLAYLFVVLLQQPGGQVCRSTQFILEERKTAVSRWRHTFRSAATYRLYRFYVLAKPTAAAPVFTCAS